MRRMRAGEAGVTIVEAAFVIPLLFMFMFGLVDLGMWTLNSNQASNAARDGARVGILELPLRGGDLATAEAEIVAAIEEHLPEGTMDGSDVSITCLASDDTTIPCTDPEPDRVKVDVAWEWRLVTPVATILGIDEGDVQGSATMEIVGRPVPGNGGVDPNTPDPLNPAPVMPCSISDLVAPAEVFARGQQLAGPMLITFKYVSGDCSDVQVVLTGTKATGAETFTHYCGCGDPPNHRWEYAGSNNIWKANGNRGVVTVYSGANRTTPLARREFAVR